MKTRNSRTLVLNADWRPLTIVSWKRAIVLGMEQRVQMLDFYKDDSIKDGHGRCYPIPAVVASTKYVKRDYRHAPFCKKNIFLRDSLVCQYCGQTFEPHELTFDHVIPRSVWNRTHKDTDSPTTWENIVTCCLWCNRKKGDKTCEQAKMFPLTHPVRPAYGELFLGLSPWRDSIPQEWIAYLQYLPLFKGLKTNEKQEATVQ